VRETVVTALPKLGFVTMLVLLGVYTPEPLARLLQAVAQSIGGR
jgi:hydrogenase-4 component F